MELNLGVVPTTFHIKHFISLLLQSSSLGCCFMFCYHGSKSQATLNLSSGTTKLGKWPLLGAQHKKQTAVNPVYNGSVLSDHPLLSGQVSQSRFFVNTNAVFVTCIRWSAPLSGCGLGHPVAVLCLS